MRSSDAFPKPRPAPRNPSGPGPASATVAAQRADVAALPRPARAKAAQYLPPMPRSGACDDDDLPPSRDPPASSLCGPPFGDPGLVLDERRPSRRARRECGSASAKFTPDFARLWAGNRPRRSGGSSPWRPGVRHHVCSKPIPPPPSPRRADPRTRHVPGFLQLTVRSRSISCIRRDAIVGWRVVGTRLG